MRRWLATLLAVASLAVQAQVPFTPQMLMPSPLGIILMVGQWLVQDNKRVYHIRVAGTGETPEQARLNGFRLAVEQALGTVILSETEVANSRIRRNEIISYASGFVDKFTILDTTIAQGRYQVSMDVWVSESRIANRLLNESAGTGAIDGARLTTQVDTLQQERVSGDRVLEAVLRDFPRRAFDVQVERTRVDFTTQRNLQIDVPYTVSWNSTYLDSFQESLRRVGTERATCWWPSQECAQRQRRQISVFGVAIEDEPRVVVIIRHMAQDQKPAVMLTITDAHNRVLARSCQGLLFSNVENMPYNVPNRFLFMVGSNSVSVDRRLTMPGRFSLNFGSNPEVLRTAQNINVRVLPERECADQR